MAFTVQTANGERYLTFEGTGALRHYYYAPTFIMENSTAEDISGGRESFIIGVGHQSGNESSYLGKHGFSHDGCSDDQKGKWAVYINDGSDGESPTLALTIDSALKATLEGNTWIKGSVGIGADVDSTVKLYIVAPDAQSAIYYGVFGSTLSDASINYGVVGNASGGSGTSNYGVWARGINASTNHHFHDNAGNYSDGTGWHDVSDPAKKDLIRALKDNDLKTFYDTLASVSVMAFRYKNEVKFKRDAKDKLIPTGEKEIDSVTKQEVDVYEKMPIESAQERFGFLACDLPDFLATDEKNSVTPAWMCAVLWEICRDQEKRIKALEK
jgi:hypothetical protein